MPEKDKLFSSKIKYDGILSFKDFYNFCFNFLVDEIGLDLNEDKYKEKLSGDAKGMEIEWSGSRKLTDYFKIEMKVTFYVLGLTNIEVVQDGKKIKTNKGSVEVTVKGTLVRDYDGKFEKSATQKFMRGIYEKMVIPSRIFEYEGKIIEDCNDFLSQAKAYLDLEGKR